MLAQLIHHLRRQKGKRGRLGYGGQVDVHHVSRYIISAAKLLSVCIKDSKFPGCFLSHLQNDLFAQTLRYARNFILEISIW
jgi:hypothetical protein